MKKNLILTIFILLFLVTPTFAFEWRVVGGNPFIGSADLAMGIFHRYGYLSQSEMNQARIAFQSSQTQKEIVVRGDNLVAMISGSGRLDRNVYCNWQNFCQLEAETVIVGNKKIFHYFACNNYGIKIVTPPAREKPPAVVSPPNITVNVNIKQEQVQVQHIPIAPPGGYTTSTQWTGGGWFSISPVYRQDPSNFSISNAFNNTSTANPTNNYSPSTGAITNTNNPTTGPINNTFNPTTGSINNTNTANGGSSSSAINNSGNSTNTNNNANSNVNTNNNPKR